MLQLRQGVKRPVAEDGDRRAGISEKQERSEKGGDAFVSCLVENSFGQ